MSSKQTRTLAPVPQHMCTYIYTHTHEYAHEYIHMKAALGTYT